MMAVDITGFVGVDDAGYAVERERVVTPTLSGVSETMLWALHNRAIETRRQDGILDDPESARIHDAIKYDFTRHFGEPAGSLAARAAEIDRMLRGWLERHPDGIVVSLGEGLETQRHRVDNGRMRWLSVDLPDAIRLREHFLAPTDRFQHVAASVLDSVWMDAVDASADVFIVAQGLLMYLEPAWVRLLFTSIADRFPGAEIVFDAVPRWFSHLTLSGLNQTPHYRLPAMPWGINRDELEPTLRFWHPDVSHVTFLDYNIPRGLPRLLADMTSQIPVARNGIPTLVHVSINGTGHSSAAGGESAPLPGVGESGFGLQQHRPRMLSADGEPASLRDIVDIATQNATSHGDIALATTQVIAKRVALGLAAAANPESADHVEFTRMVQEKIEAFTEAGMVMLKQSGHASQQILRLASDEVMTSVHATMELTACSGPASFVEAQRKFANDWFARMTSNFITIGMLTLTAQAAAMVPIRETVLANADRLSRQPDQTAGEAKGLKSAW